MKESWVGSIADTMNTDRATSRYLQRFLWSYEGLGIIPEYIHGRVLIAGGAYFLPERSLICTPESFFREPRNDIASIWVTDGDHMFTDEMHFTWPFLNGNKIPFTSALQSEKKVVSYALPMKYLLHDSPLDFFDLITFFGIPDFGNQLNDQLLTIIEQKLKPNGVFMGAGGFYDVLFGDPLTMVADTVKKTGLQMRHSIKMDDFGDPVGPYTNRIGLILQKT